MRKSDLIALIMGAALTVPLLYLFTLYLLGGL